MSEPGVELRIVSPAATIEEIAAVTAVLQAALGELADDMAVEGDARASAWQRRQRSVRTTLTAGPGAWRNFSG